jgi:hypothetical protein
MLEWVIAYWVVTFLATLALGYAQTIYTDNQAFYSYSAIGLMVVQAVATTAIYAGTFMFSVGAGVLALTLICHHIVIHRNSEFEGETCSCACFQAKDASNHETWIVACIVAAWVSALHI